MALDHTVRQEEGLILMGGPCSVESYDQIMRIAESVRKAGATWLRGGAWKPRTEANAWTGLHKKGLELLQQAGRENGLRIVTEILGLDDLETSYAQMFNLFREYDVGMLQIGARNYQNQSLLTQVARTEFPVLLKNGIASTMKEWLGSAGRIPKEQVLLCARGQVRDTDVARNGQDIATIDHLVNSVDYPIIFDPSHIAGKRDPIFGITMGAVAMGVDGLIVEVHHDPVMSRTDAEQAITPEQFRLLVDGAKQARNLYLEQRQLSKSYRTAPIPEHVRIYCLERTIPLVQTIAAPSNVQLYDQHQNEEAIHTGTVPRERLALLQKYFNLGELATYSPKSPQGKGTTVVHVTTPDGNKYKLTPYNDAALDFTETKPGVTPHGTRVPLVHRHPGDTLIDLFTTLAMMRAKSEGDTRDLMEHVAVEWKLLAKPTVLWQQYMAK